MPKCAAPNATKVATSKLRTRMMSMLAWLVEKASLRDLGLSKSASGSMPAARTMGITSSRMRPLGSASTSLSFCVVTSLLHRRADRLQKRHPSKGRIYKGFSLNFPADLAVFAHPHDVGAAGGQ